MMRKIPFEKDRDLLMSVLESYASAENYNYGKNMLKD